MRNEDLRFFLIDTGVDVQNYCQYVCDKLQKDGHHYLLYLSDQPNLFCIEEIFACGFVYQLLFETKSDYTIFVESDNFDIVPSLQ